VRVKLDENIPAGVAGALASLGHDVDTVPEEGLAGEADETVWAATKADKRFFVT
jgi:predicted nuclease of predicted toxin-antitoxin system